ncbi:MAG TPA: GDSL-type esterase/lipase family protein, partial [Bacteroidales bacterium]|nr:GDSL-type esterase/lipase family protein [Bacteroidales bacterium]
PQVVRIGLQNLQPGLFGGRGLIFPTAMTGSNNPRNFSVSWTGHWDKCRNTERNRNCNLGITGQAVTTTDSLATISFRSFSGIPKGAHNRIRIYHFDALNAYSFNVLTEDPYLINDIRYFPDAGYSEIILNTPVDTFTLEISRSTSANSVFELYGIELLLDGPGITYSSLGVNGASLPSFIRCNLLQEQISILNPDLIIISLGTNDGFTRDFNPDIYKRNYVSLITIIRNACPEADLLLTVPNDVLIKKKRSNKNTSLQEEVIYQLASSYECGVWNFFRVMGGHNSVPSWYINGLMQRDRVHFTVPGYQIKGELMLEAFLKSYSIHLDEKAKQNQL